MNLFPIFLDTVAVQKVKLFLCNALQDWVGKSKERVSRKHPEGYRLHQKINVTRKN